MRFARRAYGSLPSEYDTFNAPLATASPPRGMPIAKPTISGATTPIVFRSACHALIFDRSTCVTICHSAFIGLGFCCSAGATLLIAVVDGGEVAMKGHALPPAANCDSSGQRQARSINLAHVLVRVEKLPVAAYFFWIGAYPASNFLHLRD
jgi:hypothetical protein